MSLRRWYEEEHWQFNKLNDASGFSALRPTCFPTQRAATGEEEEGEKRKRRKRRKREIPCNYIPWVLVLLVLALVGGIEELR